MYIQNLMLFVRKLFIIHSKAIQLIIVGTKFLCSYLVFGNDFRGRNPLEECFGNDVLPEEVRYIMKLRILKKGAVFLKKTKDDLIPSIEFCERNQV